MSTDEKIIKQLTSRIERLERAVFGSGKKPVEKKNPETNYKGATGGIRMLIGKNFFSGKKSLADVRKALEEKGYHYSGPAVQMALGRMSNRTGPLLSSENKGKKVYVIRK